MQTEATNTVQAVQSRVLNNKHYAAQLRNRLLSVRGRAKQGYHPDDPFVHILNDLTDEQLIAKSIAHSVLEKMPIEQIKQMYS
jgi:hypothetical protein